MVETYARYEYPLIPEMNRILHIDRLIRDLLIAIPAIGNICRMTRTPLQSCCKRVILAQLPAVLILASLHACIVFPAEVHGLKIAIAAQIPRRSRPLLEIIGGRYHIINCIMMRRRKKIIIGICINRPVQYREC